MIDASLTLVDPVRDKCIDVHVFADSQRYLTIRDGAVAERLFEAVKQEAPRTSFAVGGGSATSQADFYELDLRHNKDLRQAVSHVVDAAFVDASARVLKQVVGREPGLLSVGSDAGMEALAAVIELRKFIMNAMALGRKRRMLFRFEAVASALLDAAE